jgi:hypothetical protein
MSITPTTETYDVVITKGSDAYGYMVEKNRDGSYKWVVRDAESPEAISSWEALKYADYGPNRGMMYAQNTAHRGMGRIQADHSDGRIAAAWAADTRFREKIMPGPVVTMEELVGNGIANAGVEVWTNGGSSAPDNWSINNVVGALYVARDSAQVHGGDYSAKLYRSTVGNGDFRQTLSHTVFAGRTITFKIWLRRQRDNARTKTLLRITDNTGYSETVVNNDAGQDTETVAYTEVEVTRALGGGITSLYVSLWCEIIANGGTNSFWWVDDASIETAGLTAAPGVAFAELANNVYLVGGSAVYKRNDGSWQLLAIVPSGEYTDIKTYDDRVFCPYGDTGYQHIQTDGTVTNVTDDTSLAAVYGAINAAGETPVFWRVLRPNLMYSSTDPEGAPPTWSAAWAIGSSDSEIVGVVVEGKNMYVVKEDGVFYFDSSSNVEQIWTKTMGNPTTSARPIAAQGKVFLMSARNKLWECDPVSGVALDISPKQYIPDMPEFHGTIKALAHDGTWLYAFVQYGDVDDSTSVTYLLAGRWTQIRHGEGTEPYFAWHNFATLAMSDLRAAYVTDSDGDELRLWFAGQHYGGAAYTPYVGYVQCDPTKYVSVAKVRLPRLYGGFYESQKSWYSIKVFSSDLAASAQTVRVKFRVNDGSWTQAGIVDASPFEEVFLPANTFGYWMDIEVWLETTDEALPSTVYAVVAEGRVRFPKRKVMDGTLRVAQGVQLRNGARELEDTDTLAQFLRDCDDATWPVQIQDFNGNNKYVDILSLAERSVIDEKTRKGELYVDIVAMEADLS